mmetsp:Transcript_8755/g.21451  ORF Transcript_8755/g.21451 Transcript_8755/m.21451 type:complete len:90 (+) Transcript_8755:1223-1492(+)
MLTSPKSPSKIRNGVLSSLRSAGVEYCVGCNNFARRKMEERATTVTEVRSRVNERIVDSFSHIQLDVSWTVTDGMVGNNMPSVIKSRVP